MSIETTLYFGPPDPQARYLIDRALEGKDVDYLNAELLRHYLDRGYVLTDRRAWAMKTIEALT